ncbi:hypothetical protein, partial [Actinophytocola sp.]|uniref:hypothetical protein n=1 Tax=Actinophytocola sp. TaxID=1872138 RepID=UPI003D6A1566
MTGDQQTSRDLVFVSERVCREVLTVAEVAEQVERTFHAEAAGKVIYSTPHVLRMVDTGESRAGGTASFRTKGAILPDLGVAGFRLGASRIAADGSGSASPLATRLVLLMDIETASPLALVDEHYNYLVRTAASVAVTLKSLVPDHARLGLVGTGGVGIAVAQVFTEVLPLESIHVTSRRPERRHQFAEKMKAELSVPIYPTDTVDELV